MTDLTIAFEPLSCSALPTQMATAINKDALPGCDSMLGRMFGINQRDPAHKAYDGASVLPISSVSWKILSVDKPDTIKMIVPGLFLGVSPHLVNEEDPQLGSYARFTPSNTVPMTSLVCNLLVEQSELKQLQRIWKYMCYLREDGTPEWDGYEGNSQLLPRWTSELEGSDTQLLTVSVNPGTLVSLMGRNKMGGPCKPIDAIIKISNGGQKLTLVDIDNTKKLAAKEEASFSRMMAEINTITDPYTKISSFIGRNEHLA